MKKLTKTVSGTILESRVRALEGLIMQAISDQDTLSGLVSTLTSIVVGGERHWPEAYRQEAEKGVPFCDHGELI